MKNLYIFAGGVLLVGALIFWRDVIALFAGMTPLESIQFIGNAMLHTAVVTICLWGATTLPELVKPWARMLRKAGRRRRKAVYQGVQVQRVKDSSLQRTLMAIAAKQAGVKEIRPSQPTEPQRINVNLK